MSLISLGWNTHWEALREERDLAVSSLARVGAIHADGPVLIDAEGLRQGAFVRSGLFPAVGDWVLFSQRAASRERAVVEEILPRRTAIARKASGRISEHRCLAANIDWVFIVSALDAEFKASRLERYLTMVWDSGASPMVLLTKLDACPDPTPFLERATEAACGVPVHAVSSLEGRGINEIIDKLVVGTTAVFVGSSGVGKSTLVNRILGHEVLAIGSVRTHDRRGRHTTTHRELIPLEGGGVVIDTPGLRELQPVGDDRSLNKAFADIEGLAESCRFHDCRHESEPGCAVQAAISAGSLSGRRLANFDKIRREMAHQAERGSGDWRRRKRERAVHKGIRQAKRIKHKR